ncbi:hypothetical protein UlMin_035520, partial [Ulmus minor]
SNIWHDLRLLENQLPFFILKNFWTQLSSSDIAYFIDFLISIYIPLSRSGRKINTFTIPKMIELHGAGVKLKVGSSRNLFDLQFSKGVLEILKLTISDETELTIRKLLAFEQCYCIKNYLNDYVVMMDCLVDTPKDVALLVKYGIVENRLGNNFEGSTLINNLVDGVTVEYKNFYFAKNSEELNDYHRISWHKWKANLKQNYFNTPWATVSVTIVILLIILTIIQVVCSISL